MQTSEIAKKAQVHPNTVRLYEEWQYISAVPRKKMAIVSTPNFIYNKCTLLDLPLDKNLFKITYVKWPQKSFDLVDKNILTKA